MSRLKLANAGIALASLVLGALLASRAFEDTGLTARMRGTRLPAAGTLVDSSGKSVPLGDFRRIVSGSQVADDLLLALSEPERVLVYTQYSVSMRAGAHRFSGKPSAPGLDDLEALIQLQPDLVLLHGSLRPARTQRLRAAGLTVFDLGELEGVSSLLGDIEAVSVLLGHPERGEQLARSFRARLERISLAAEGRDLARGLLLTVRGGVLFGGTRGTSYHDVLTSARLVDVAARSYTGWPRYTSEQILELDPDVIVTELGMAVELCRHPGLDQLRACTGGGRIIEVEASVLASPGLDMLTAAERIADQLWAAPPG